MKFLLIPVLALVLAAGSARPAHAGSQVDINYADAMTIAKSLEGVGLVKAEAIVAYRNAHGPFASLDDLARVKGIGPRILDENRDVIVFGGTGPGAGSRGAAAPRPTAYW
jgi:competence protein ComEA